MDEGQVLEIYRRSTQLKAARHKYVDASKGVFLLWLFLSALSHIVPRSVVAFLLSTSVNWMITRH